MLETTSQRLLDFPFPRSAVVHRQHLPVFVFSSSVLDYYQCCCLAHTMTFRAKLRNPIIAGCVVGVFLVLFVCTIVACVRRFNKEAIARRAQEAELHAAQAISRAERRRRRRLELPEAEPAPANAKYKDPALGNVVIKDAEAFNKLRDELIEVDMTTVRLGTKAAAKPKTTTTPTTAPDAASVSAIANAGEALTETFVNGDDEPQSQTHNVMQQLHSEEDNNNEENDADDYSLPYGRSLDKGGFVIVVCDSSVGEGQGDDAASHHRSSNSRNELASVAAATNGATTTAAQTANTEAEVEPVAGTCDTMIRLYRCQPSRSVYGESRYMTEVEAMGADSKQFFST